MAEETLSIKEISDIFSDPKQQGGRNIINTFDGFNSDSLHMATGATIHGVTDYIRTLKGRINDVMCKYNSLNTTFKEVYDSDRAFFHQLVGDIHRGVRNRYHLV